jgi:hypothetical protein
VTPVSVSFSLTCLEIETGTNELLLAENPILIARRTYLVAENTNLFPKIVLLTKKPFPVQKKHYYSD